MGRGVLEDRPCHHHDGRGLNNCLAKIRGVALAQDICLKTDFGGLPIAFHLTGVRPATAQFRDTPRHRPQLDPRAALGVKGYDSKSNRDATRQCGICPAIAYRSNTKDIPPSFRRCSTRVAPVSSKQSGSSKDLTHRTSMREDGAELRLVRRGTPSYCAAFLCGK